jgi:DNA repair protein RecO (recombination protein O)
LLRSSLALLNEGVDPWPVARHFELALVVTLGYRPELLTCVNCHNDLKPVPNAFSSQLGGMLCENCAGMDRGAVMLGVNAQKYLRTLARSGLAAVMPLRPSEADRHQVGQAMYTYLRYVGERDFSSLRVLGNMQVSAPPAS